MRRFRPALPALLLMLPAGLAAAEEARDPRAALADAGLELELGYTAELLGNLQGGVRRGAIYQGQVRLGLTLDLEKAAGLAGLRAQVSALNIHGRGLSANYVDNLMTTSSVEAAPSTRLYTAWLEQELAGGAVSLRVGQILADEEFLVSEQAGSFVNATFGWPTLPATTLPGGGPAYPLATPGLRLRLAPAEGHSLQVAVFNGDPAGGRPGDAQRRNPNGLLFPLGDDAFAIAEYAYAPQAGPFGLPAAFKLGGWWHTGRFEDLRADPAEERRLRGNQAAYALADVMLWRPPGRESGGLGVFLRGVAAPGGRNQVTRYLDGGVTFTGLLPGRMEDVLGFGFAHARLGQEARRRDSTLERAESLVELTYKAQITESWAVQPTLQYVVNPGAQQGRDNALVLGLRSAVQF